MKKYLVLSVFFLILSSAANAHAVQNIRHESGFAALKMDYLKFTDNDLKKFGPEDGPYVGLEAYALMRPHWYVGAEIGYFNRDSCGCVFVYGGDGSPVMCDVDKELTIVPIELNVKYNTGYLTDTASLMIGAGVSYNYAKLEASAIDLNIHKKDWLIGAQISLDVNFEFNRFFLGINGKYQVTEKMQIKDIDTDVKIDNWRVGGQIGMRF